MENKKSTQNQNSKNNNNQSNHFKTKKNYSSETQQQQKMEDKTNHQNSNKNSKNNNSNQNNNQKPKKQSLETQQQQIQNKNNNLKSNMNLVNNGNQISQFHAKNKNSPESQQQQKVDKTIYQNSQKVPKNNQNQKDQFNVKYKQNKETQQHKKSENNSNYQNSKNNPINQEKQDNGQKNNLKPNQKKQNANGLEGNHKNGLEVKVKEFQILSKYCKNALLTFKNCFENGIFKYPGHQIEVPPEQFKELKDLFKQSGNKDQFIRKGKISYKIAKNIAKSGIIEGLIYDSVQGVQITFKTYGVSALCAFAFSIWKGNSFEEAFIDCIETSASVFSQTVISNIASQRISRSSLNVFTHKQTLDILKKVLNKDGFASYANSFRQGQKPIYGAAAQNNVAKIVKGQVMYSISILFLQTGWDIIKVLKNRISGKQLAKNLACNAIGAGGSLVGSLYGTVIAGPVGGILGSIIGGVATQFITKKIVDIITPDDLEQMAVILRAVIAQLQKEFLLYEEEMEIIIQSLQKELLQKDFLEKMFECSEKNKFTRGSIKPYFKKSLSNRKRIDSSDLQSS